MYPDIPDIPELTAEENIVHRFIIKSGSVNRDDIIHKFNYTPQQCDDMLESLASKKVIGGMGVVKHEDMDDHFEYEDYVMLYTMVKVAELDRMGLITSNYGVNYGARSALIRQADKHGYEPPTLLVGLALMGRMQVDGDFELNANLYEVMSGLSDIWRTPFDKDKDKEKE